MANFFNMFKPKSKKLKRHIDARDDNVCRAFMKADELRSLVPQPLARRGNQADRSRLSGFEAFAANKVARRYMT